MVNRDAHFNPGLRKPEDPTHPKAGSFRPGSVLAKPGSDNRFFKILAIGFLPGKYPGIPVGYLPGFIPVFIPDLHSKNIAVRFEYIAVL